jgi:hypothetical protein
MVTRSGRPIEHEKALGFQAERFIGLAQSNKADVGLARQTLKDTFPAKERRSRKRRYSRLPHSAGEKMSLVL